MDFDFNTKTVMVTGATGLIGKAIIHKLQNYNTNIIAVVRDVKKGKQIIGNINNIRFIESDITEVPLNDLKVDYVIHAAANTSSKAFVSDPVNIIKTNLIGTMRMLDFSKINKVKGFIYLSSMEVYGTPLNDEKINEDHFTNLNTMIVRSSYPESKRLCECLCVSYMEQYGLPIKVIRLTQTFGPGVRYDDKRVFAEFARCVIEGKDIVLHTTGETKRSYLYLDDAVTAIFYVLVNGKIGEAYNAANEDTYCSIYEMASMVAQKCAQGCISVIIDNQDSTKFGYAPILKMNLDTKKLQQLGWKSNVGLKEMYDILIDDMKKSKNN